MYEVGADGGFRYIKIGLQCCRECFAVAGINISESECKEQHRQALRTVIEN